MAIRLQPSHASQFLLAFSLGFSLAFSPADSASADPARLYWVDTGDGVYTCELPSCATVTEVIDNDLAVRAVEVDPIGERIYYGDRSSGTPSYEGIRSTDLSGGDDQEHYRAPGSLGGLAINGLAMSPDGDGIYYGNTSGPYRIRKVVIPGNSLVNVLPSSAGNGNQNLGHLNFDTGVSPPLLYWQSAFASDQIWRAGVAVLPIATLETPFNDVDLQMPFRIDPDDRRIYYALDGTIMRAELPDFTNPEAVVVTGGGFGQGMALDLTDRRVYWSNNSDAEILRAPMDPPFGLPEMVYDAPPVADLSGMTIVQGSAESVPALGPMMVSLLTLMLGATGAGLITRRVGARAERSIARDANEW